MSLLGTILAISAGSPFFQRFLIKQSVGLFSIERTLPFLQASYMICAVPPALSGMGYTQRYLSLLTGSATQPVLISDTHV